MREIPYSGRSENPFTRAAQDRDRALLPEMVQALLRELFEIRDKFAKDEAGLAEAIEKELTARDADRERLIAIGRSYGAELAEEDKVVASPPTDRPSLTAADVVRWWLHAPVKDVEKVHELVDAAFLPPTDRDAAIVAEAETLVANWDKPGDGNLYRNVESLKAAVDLPKGAPVGETPPRCTICLGTGRRRISHDHGRGQSVTYEACSCAKGAQVPSIPPAAVSEIMRVAKWLDCDPDMYSIMGASEPRIRSLESQLATEFERGRREGWRDGQLSAHRRLNQKAIVHPSACLTPYEPGNSDAGDKSAQ